MESHANTNVAANTGDELVKCMQQVQGHAPMLTAHTIIMDFTSLRFFIRPAVIMSMAALLGGIRFPHLRVLEIRMHELHQSNTEDQWLCVGRALAAMPAEQRASIHTLRISGLTLPNPTLSSMLAHLPQIHTLRLPWAWVRTTNYVSVGQLTVMWQQLRHVEDVSDLSTASPSMLRAMCMPSVTHVSLADREVVRLEQLTTLFPGVQQISGGYVSVRAKQLPTHIPDCTALRVSVDDDTLPTAQLQLQAGTMPSMHTCIVRISVPDCTERVRNLLVQLLEAAPNMRCVCVVFEYIHAPVQTAAPILQSLVGSKRLGRICMQFQMHAGKRGECKQLLDAALQQSFELVGYDRLELVVGDCAVHVVANPGHCILHELL